MGLLGSYSANKIYLSIQNRNLFTIFGREPIFHYVQVQENELSISKWTLGYNIYHERF